MEIYQPAILTKYLIVSRSPHVFITKFQATYPINKKTQFGKVCFKDKRTILLCAVDLNKALTIKELDKI